MANIETVQVMIDGESRRVTLGEAREYALGMVAKIAGIADTLLAERVRLGALLLEMRTAVGPRGQWTVWLDSLRLDPRAARKAMQLATRFALPNGLLSNERLFAALHDLDPAGFPSLSLFDVNTVTLRQAQIAAGIRVDPTKRPHGAANDESGAKNAGRAHGAAKHPPITDDTYDDTNADDQPFNDDDGWDESAGTIDPDEEVEVEFNGELVKVKARDFLPGMGGPGDDDVAGDDDQDGLPGAMPAAKPGMRPAARPAIDHAKLPVQKPVAKPVDKSSEKPGDVSDSQMRLDQEYQRAAEIMREAVEHISTGTFHAGDLREVIARLQQISFRAGDGPAKGGGL